MSKQKRQAIGQMILAALLCAAVVIPGMVAVEVGRANEQAAQAAKAEQDQRALADKVAAIKSVVATEPEKAPEVLSYWESIPLDKELQNYIVETSHANGIPPQIIMAMIDRESTYTASRIGDNGNSYGLMQIQPRWHYQRMADLGCTNLLDGYQNVTVGIDYLAELLDRYSGDIAKALTAYNRGHYSGTVTEYATVVLAQAERLGGANVYEYSR